VVEESEVVISIAGGARTVGMTERTVGTTVRTVGTAVRTVGTTERTVGTTVRRRWVRRCADPAVGRQASKGVNRHNVRLEHE